MDGTEDDFADFSIVVREAIDSGRLTVGAIAREFSCSLPTVRRWRDGLSAPHRFVRPRVVEWIRDHVK